MCILIFSSICQAEAIPEGEFHAIFKPFGKLGRGIVNIVTSPKEIPIQILGSAVEQNEKYDNNGAAALAGAFSGVFKGIGWTLYRLVAGVYDVVTFPFPLPAYEYSIIEPEYVPKFRDVLEGRRLSSSE
jgi:putative exosortase-associated protein (TIGR04073 family)